MPQVRGPYNRPWANNISADQSNLIKSGIFLSPSSTPQLGRQSLQTYQRHAPAESQLNGMARDLLLFVEASALRLTVFSYAIQIRRRQVQEVVNAFYQQYSAMLRRYQEKKKYPINGPVEIRFTTMDRSDDLGVPGAVPPALSICRSVSPDDPTLDTVCWIGALTFPGTKYANEFYVELEMWMKSQWGTPGNNVLRPEWSKAWACTEEKGAWSDLEMLTKDIPAHYDQPSGTSRLEWARQTLAKYDKFNIYTNPFLSVLLPG